MPEDLHHAIDPVGTIKDLCRYIAEHVNDQIPADSLQAGVDQLFYIAADILELPAPDSDPEADAPGGFI
jgi:hypothetical protein